MDLETGVRRGNADLRMNRSPGPYCRALASGWKATGQKAGENNKHMAFILKVTGAYGTADGCGRGPRDPEAVRASTVVQSPVSTPRCKSKLLLLGL